HGAAGEAPCSDRDVEGPPPGHDDLCDAASIRLRAAAPQAHRSTPDARAAIAVDDGDDEPHGATDLGQRRPLSMERRRGPEAPVGFLGGAACSGRTQDYDDR